VEVNNNIFRMISNDDDKTSFLLLDSVVKERLDTRISLSQISKFVDGV
jgi:hypothetical protein